MTDAETIADLRAELARVRAALDAQEYRGNSVAYWWTKAAAYGGIVYQVCDAFRRLGYTGELGDTTTLPERLSKFTDERIVELARVKAERDAALKRVSEFEGTTK